MMDDAYFCSVVEVSGGKPHDSSLSWEAESTALVEDIFGGNDSEWNYHVVDLRNVAHDLLPVVLGSLLELYAFEIFKRGQGNTFPTLLVLEEAHHYMRQISDSDDSGKGSLAYERLAKEGRKFGVSLLLSTQRPSEVSQTVISQCGTWVVFRLVSESDLNAVRHAAEWIDKSELNSIAGLPRQHAIVFGSSISMPTKISSLRADPTPKSRDPDFSSWLE